MPDRLAIKRLTASDLTFFESLFRTIGAGNQKAINLNADVFVDELYPALPSLVPTLGDVIPVSLAILGPAASPEHVISRAVTKREAYKNWRLNGEFVRDPDSEPGRFNILKAGDLAVMEFVGDPSPLRLTLLLLAASSPADASLHAALNPLITGGRRTMVRVARHEIASAAAAVAATHPIWILAADPEFDAALEDAAFGGTKGTATIRAKVSRTVTAATLAAAKAAAEKNGRDGEALAWIHLQKMKSEMTWATIEWSSQANAVSSFDFKAIDDGGLEVLIDAKSTNGEFGRTIHMSVAEIAAAADAGRYDLWRVYDINEDGAKMRIAENIGANAKAIISAMKMPTGVTIDSVSIDPAILNWGAEIVIIRPDDAPGVE